MKREPEGAKMLREQHERRFAAGNHSNAPIQVVAPAPAPATKMPNPTQAAKLAGLSPSEMRVRAKSLGLMAQSEMRQRLGYNISNFNRLIGKAGTPPVKFTLENGEHVFDRELAEEFLKVMGK